VHRVAAGMKAGTVWINTYGYTDVRLPWGGSGGSGMGRFMGLYEPPAAPQAA